MIVKEIVQGPTLAVAATVASRLGVIFQPTSRWRSCDIRNPLVRAPACSCARPAYEIVATLIELLGDLDGKSARLPLRVLWGEWEEWRRAIL